MSWGGQRAGVPCVSLGSSPGSAETLLEGGRELFLLSEGISGVGCVTSSPSALVCFADVHQRGQTDSHPAASPQHTGGFLGSGLGLHLHICGCAEPAAGTGQGQQPRHSPPLARQCAFHLCSHAALITTASLLQEPAASLWAPSRRAVRTVPAPMALQRWGVPSLTAREDPSPFAYPCPGVLSAGGSFCWLQHCRMVPSKWLAEPPHAHCSLWARGWCEHFRARC